MKLKLVIFDVDGTVYDQKKLRLRMLAELLLYLVRAPLHISRIRILSKFRKLIEDSRKQDSTGYYSRIIQHLSDRFKKSNAEISMIIDEWMYQRPLKHLVNRGSREVREVLGNLESLNIPWTFYSDYYPNDKLDALNIKYSSTYYSSMDKIDCLKPDPRSIDVILGEYGVKSQECVIIGDRISVDGELAINSQTHFILFKASDNTGTLAASVRSLVEAADESFKELRFITT